jgi:hypothetical protein
MKRRRFEGLSRRGEEMRERGNEGMKRRRFEGLKV